MKVFVRRRIALGMALAFLFALLPAPGSFAFAAKDVAGTVTRLKGAAVAMQDAFPRPLKAGDRILRGDVISTGTGARLEMTMLDEAVMTLGEKTIFVVIDYIAQGQPNAAMRLLEGSFSAVSGDMMKIAGARFTVDTPTATIGIRGTRFWGGTLNGVFEVALLGAKLNQGHEPWFADKGVRLGRLALFRPTAKDRFCPTRAYLAAFTSIRFSIAAIAAST